MKSLFKVSMILAVAMATSATTTQAGILWEFTYTDATAGEVLLIETDGDLVNGEAPAGSYIITQATLFDSIVQPSSIGNVLTDFQAPSGFIWDGVDLTQAFRSGGNFTNGVNLNDAGTAWTFGPGRGNVEIGGEEEGGIILRGGLSVAVIPEPTSLALLTSLTVGSLVMTRRRRD